MTPEEIEDDDHQRDQRRAQEELQRQKEVEFFAASTNAWFNTALEHDKSIFTLSAGGIGLLVTLMTGVSTSLMLHLYIGAILFFLVSLCMVLAIFRRNRTHIEQVLSGESKLDPILSLLDIGSKISFIVGMLLTAIIGISAASSSYDKEIAKKDVTMTEKKQNPASDVQGAFDSVNGLGGLQKSFNNLAAIQPKPPTPAPSASASQPPTPSKPSGSK